MAARRTVIQLLLVGLVLKTVFASNSPFRIGLIPVIVAAGAAGLAIRWFA